MGVLWQYVESHVFVAASNSSGLVGRNIALLGHAQYDVVILVVEGGNKIHRS
jgi:hypothetical protein